MNKKNRNFEDILLTGAFEEYLRREDEKLPSDGELREKFPPREEECRKYGEMARRKGRASSAMVILKRVAVITLAVISVTFALLMMDKNVRAAVTGTIIRIFDDHTDVSFNDPNSEVNFFEGKGIHDITVGYVPEGLYLHHYPEEGTTETRTAIFIQATEEISYKSTAPYVMIMIYTSDESALFSDEAYEVTERITINGMDAFVETLFTHRKGETLEWGRLVFGDKNIVIDMIWLGVSREEAIKIAESIR